MKSLISKAKRDDSDASFFFGKHQNQYLIGIRIEFNKIIQ